MVLLITALRREASERQQPPAPAPGLCSKPSAWGGEQPVLMLYVLCSTPQLPPSLIQTSMMTTGCIIFSFLFYLPSSEARLHISMAEPPAT